VGEVCVVEFDHQSTSLSELSVRAGDLLFAVVPSEFEQRHGRHAFVEVSTIPICEPLTLLSACCGSQKKPATKRLCHRLVSHSHTPNSSNSTRRLPFVAVRNHITHCHCHLGNHRASATWARVFRMPSHAAHSIVNASCSPTACLRATQGTRMSDGLRGRVPSNCVRSLANTASSLSTGSAHASERPASHAPQPGLASLFERAHNNSRPAASDAGGPASDGPSLFGGDGADTLLDEWLGLGVGSRTQATSEGTRTWRGGYSYTPGPSPPTATTASAAHPEQTHLSPSDTVTTATTNTPQLGAGGLSWRVTRAIQSTGAMTTGGGAAVQEHSLTRSAAERLELQPHFVRLPPRLSFATSGACL
jgi:hypothetical protein